MHILCPHCHNPIEVVKITPHEEIACPGCGSTFRLETEATTGWERQAGQRLGKFELLDTVGQGAFGTVYKARDPELDRTVAIKVPRVGNLAGPQELDRFLREARSVAQLRHPSIVSVHEVGQADGVPYLVSDFVPGITLADLLSARRPTPREAAELVAAVADALQYAHERGVVHRDVKPSNIMVGDDGTPFVMDFGLAKRDAGEITMTVEGQVLGTPAYMPPEQARGEGHAVDARGDVYSLGVVLYQLLTGELPFRGTARMLLHQVLHDEPKPPRSLNDHIPRDLQTVTLKAMAKEPGKRYATARDFADDLRRWLKGEPIQARPIGSRERFQRWCRRNPRSAALSGTIAVLLVVAAVVPSILAWYLHKANDVAEQEKSNAVEARIKAEEAEQVAISQSDLSFDALGDLVLKIQQDLEEAPGGRHVRKELLEDTMRKLHRLHESPATSDRLFRRHASAHMQLGEILWNLNRRGEAEEEYKKAGEYAERAFRASPTSDKAKANVAAHNNRMGDTELFYHKRVEPARKFYEAALPLWEGLAIKMVKFPDGDPVLPELERINLVDTEEAVADTYDRMGILALRFDFNYPKAEEWFTKSLMIRKRHLEKYPSQQHRVAVGASYIYLAEWALQHNEPARALALHEELLKQREATFAERRWSLKARRELADARGKLGDDLMMAQRNDEAHKMYLASRDLFQQVMAAEPDDPVYRSLVAHAHYRSGIGFMRLGDPKAALHEFQEGLKLRQAVYEETKDARQKLNMQPQLMLALARCGKHAEAAELAASVRKNLGMMPIHLAEAGSCYGLCMTAVGAGKSPDQLTPDEKQLRQNYLALAIATYDEARAKKWDLSDLLLPNGDTDLLLKTPEFQQWLDSFPLPEWLGEFIDSGQLTKGEQEYRAALDERRREAAKFPEQARYRRHLVLKQFRLGMALFRAGKRREGEVEFKAAVALCDRLAAEFPDNRDDAYARALAHSVVASEYERVRSYAEAADWLGRCLPLLAAVQARWPAGEVSERIGWAHCHRALALHGLARHAEGIREYDQGIPLLLHGERERWVAKRAAALAGTGEHAEAVRIIEDVLKDEPVLHPVIYDAACACAMSAAAVKDDAKLRDEYAAKALALLYRAKDAGHFRSREGSEELKTDPDLVVLRAREDFQKLLTEVADEIKK